jgi:flagellar FliL protein
MRGKVAAEVGDHLTLDSDTGFHMATSAGTKLQAVRPSAAGGKTADAAPPEALDAAPARMSKARLLRVALRSLAALAVIGGAAGWYFLGGGQAWVAQQTAPKPQPPQFIALETMTVNLQPDNGDRYLQVGITLKSYEKGAEERVKLYMPELRSRVLMLLSTKTPAQLYAPGGKEALMQEILALTRKPYSAEVKDLLVKEVLFTTFVIQ